MEGIGSVGATPPLFRGVESIHRLQSGTAVNPSESVKDQLQQQIEQVNGLQRDASKAIEHLAAERRCDLQSVMLAKEKTDAALALLLDVRQKVAEAYSRMSRI